MHLGSQTVYQKITWTNREYKIRPEIVKRFWSLRTGFFYVSFAENLLKLK